MRSQALRAAALRVGALRLLIVCMFFVLAGRAAWLTVLVDNTVVDHGDRQTQTMIDLTPSRGLIIDRDGHELAITVKSPSVFVLPTALDDEKADLKRLARALDMDRAALEHRVSGRKKFTYVARWVTREQAAAVEALDLAGVGIVLEPRRSYPSGQLAASIVGFSNIDGKGSRGIEQMNDEWLKGAPLTMRVERDARGRLLTDHTVDPRRAVGGDIRLSLDAGLQALAEAALQRAIDESSAQGGLVIVMDPRTGDVLSLAERPGFDPNRFRELDFSSTRSRAFSDAIEPGSTFKALLVASALDAGAIAPQQRFDTGNGSLRVKGKTIHDHDPYGELDAAGILTRSSNIGAVMIGSELGPQRTWQALRAFGFGQSTDSGFPEESAGIIRSWKNWKPVDAATVSFGQGVGVTAMQLASAMATLANDGQRMQPRLVLGRKAPMGRWEEVAPVSKGQVVSPDSARLTLEMMKGVVGPHGTARLAGLRGMDVAGKTGTAQKFDHETGRYSQTRYIAWFMAAVPADDPKLAIVVAIDEPQGPAHTGGAVAAPVFAQVATDHLAHLGLTTAPEPITAEPDPIKLAAAERFAAENAIRDHAAAAAQAEATRLEKQQAAQARAQAQAKRRQEEDRRKQALAQRAAKPAPAPTLPSVGAGPASTRTATTATGNSERAVLVPDFTGSGADRAADLAAREGLDVRVVGSGAGQVVGQTPRPGTIIVGSDRTVVLELASTSGAFGR